MQTVLIISQQNLYFGNTACVARMNNYARALSSVGVNVYLISAFSFFSGDFIEVEPHIFVCKGSYSPKRGRDFIDAFRVAKHLKDFAKTFNGSVTILNYPASQSLVLDISLLLIFKRISVYFEVNEVRKFASDSKHTFKERVYNYLLELSFQWCSGLIFISSNIQEYYRSSAKKSIVIPILSDCLTPFKPSNGIHKKEIVFVGTLSFAKENLEELLEGFYLFSKSHPDAVLKLYGYFASSEDERRLRCFVDNRRLNQIVLFLGPIEHAEVSMVLSSAGAVLLPRTNNNQNYYGFSTKLSEYATSGTPIIMTNTGVVSSFFKDKENCLMCDGYDRFSFLKVFNEWAKMSISERISLAEKAYLVAKKSFDYRNYAHQLADFLV